jgi:lambda family phage portal protein
VLDALRARAARWIAPKAGRKGGPSLIARMYANARPSRLSADWPTITGSADSELSTSLSSLRNRSRSLIRDNPYAKRAATVVVNNVIGSGIGLQAHVMSSRGHMHHSANNAIEEAFYEWSSADSCHTGGRMSFEDIERQAMEQVFATGECFIRMHSRAFGSSRVPFALELIEAERIADEYTTTNPPPGGGITRLGIEVDQYDRPLYYWIRERHPGELKSIPGASQRLERVPAAQILHLQRITRWPQSRGEPWLHAVISRLRDMDGYTEAEIIAARASACYMGFIKSAESPVPDSEEGGQRQIELSPGLVEHLQPGEDYIPHTPNRPNTGLDPFMRYMLREVASGIGVSYESLSRDYSQSNYSSSRLALLDDRDLWRMLQGWFIRNFREPIHKSWLQQAVLARAIPGISIDEYANNVRKYEDVRFKPRGWSWVDPTKEVKAYKEAVLCGFKTVTGVIAETAGGQDIEDVLSERRRELDMMASFDLKFETEPQEVAAPPPEPEETDDDDEAAKTQQRVLSLAKRSA